MCRFGRVIKFVFLSFLMIIQIASVQKLSVLTGVIDRIEGDLAVVLIEESGRQMIITVEKISSNYKEGMWVTVYEYNDYITVTVNHTKTKKYRAKSTLFLEKIKRNPIFLERIENRDENE